THSQLLLSTSTIAAHFQFFRTTSRLPSTLTLSHSTLCNSSSSTSPQTATLSPLTIYNPSSVTSGSLSGKNVRSVVEVRTRFVMLSEEMRVPVKERPSVVMTVTV